MPLRVVIVEDEPLIALDLETILEDEGHIVVGTAATTEAALGLARANPDIDMAFVNVELACEPDGVEAARRLREEHDVGSLFVSAKLTDEVRARAREWKPVGFVSKPFVRREILRAVDGLEPRPAA
ncbi:response regulator [Aureimonas leprariae]|nr:response regulator [Aureimonas leprariae]